MYDELKEEEIVRKVGGRFKLSTLIQKRMVQLNQGSRPLIDAEGQDKMAIVLQEILHDKIYLDNSDEVRTTEDFLDAPQRVEIMDSDPQQLHSSAAFSSIQFISSLKEAKSSG